MYCLSKYVFIYMFCVRVCNVEHCMGWEYFHFIFGNHSAHSDLLFHVIIVMAFALHKIWYTLYYLLFSNPHADLPLSDHLLLPPLHPIPATPIVYRLIYKRQKALGSE